MTVNVICCVLFVIFSTICVISSEVINTEVQRTIDLTSPIVKVTIDVKAINIEKEYQIGFPDFQAKQLAFLSVSKKGGKSLPTTAPVK